MNAALSGARAMAAHEDGTLSSVGCWRLAFQKSVHAIMCLHQANVPCAVDHACHGLPGGRIHSNGKHRPSGACDHIVAAEHDISIRLHIMCGSQVAHMYARMDVVLGVYWEGGRMFAQPLINEMDWFNSAGAAP